MNEAAKRNLKGYSQIISDALEEYFLKNDIDNTDGLRELRGCLTQQEYSEALELLTDGRANWRT